jgi:outer membrane protein OmpA-like peptidoglycan-associated protein
MRKIGLTLLFCSIATLPMAAMSQETATPDDFVCAFTNDCPDQNAAEDDSQPETAAPNGGRITATRSFSLSTSQPSSSSSTRRQQTRRTTGQQTVRQTARAPRVVASQPGRVNLSLSVGVGSSSLSAAARAQVNAFAQALKRPQLSSMRVAIEGHTDSTGSRASNVSLSQRRAQAVADYLVSQGVAQARLEVQGYGYDRPLPGTPASSGRNRRVEAVRIS